MSTKTRLILCFLIVAATTVLLVHASHPGFWSGMVGILFQGFQRGVGTPGKDLAFLLVCAGLWVFSLFLLSYGTKLTAWASKGEKDFPDPKTGVTLSWVTSLGVLTVWLFAAGSYVRLYGPTEVGGAPRMFAPGFLVAALVPSFVALSKVGAGMILALREAASRETTAKATWILGFHVGLNLLSIAANIVTLAQAFRK